ncbi:hypothetical protein Q3G72_028685 [Acer saccharum]|nr:hypothetical protein Q3G72_028685 [Acer saccharum]
MFYGEIPSDICKLSSLHILDLAENNLSGSIPSCLGNLSGMASDVADRYEGQLPVATKGTDSIPEIDKQRRKLRKIKWYVHQPIREKDLVT